MRAYLVMIGLICVLPVICIAVYEHRHPCLKYVTPRVFVEELTTFTSIDAEQGFMIPITTPAHYEEEVVREARK